MVAKNIFIKGAREHNLKNIDIEIPRDELIVFYRTFRFRKVLPCV